MRTTRALAAGLLALGVAGLAGCSVPEDHVQQDWEAGQSAAPPTTTVNPPTATPTPTARPKTTYAFPVRSGRAKYGKYHHDYPAADIFAPCGTAAVATTAGRVDQVSRKDVWSSRTNDGADRGGLSVSFIGDDGVRYYGSHLRSIAAGIKPGAQLRTGQELGRVGNTGDARGIACHLHYGISAVCRAGDWWVRRGAVSPYRFLKAWQRGDDVSPLKTVTAWKQGGGCSGKIVDD